MQWTLDANRRWPAHMLLDDNDDDDVVNTGALTANFVNFFVNVSLY